MGEGGGKSFMSLVYRPLTQVTHVRSQVLKKLQILKKSETCKILNES
jgi:hypothetical protein